MRISCVANATTKITTVTIRRTHSCSHYLPSARKGQPQDKARHRICQAQCKSKLIYRSTEICLLYLNSYMINQWKCLFFSYHREVKMVSMATVCDILNAMRLKVIFTLTELQIVGIETNMIDKLILFESKMKKKR